MSREYDPPGGRGTAVGPIRTFPIFDTPEKRALLNGNLENLATEVMDLWTQVESITGLQYQGLWNADTNTPTLQSGVGVAGNYYYVEVAGTTNLDGITDWQQGDWAIFNGTAWQKIDNTDFVTSVNTQTGVVVLDAADVGADPTGTATTVVGTHESTYNHGDYDTHLASSSNPHSVTAAQAGADPAGTAAGAVSTHESTYDHSSYDTHLASSANPHSVTAAQAGALPTIGSSTDNAIALWDGTSGDAVKNSGVTVEDGEAGGTLFNLAAYTSDPASPQDGDMWILNSGGIFLKFRIGGTTYAVQLT